MQSRTIRTGICTCNINRVFDIIKRKLFTLIKHSLYIYVVSSEVKTL